MKLVSKFNYFDNFENYKVIEEICKSCGVCWETRVINVSADNFHLSPNQKHALKTFQMNLLHFFEHFDEFLTIKSIFKLQTFIETLRKDFEKRAIGVFQSMTRNFIKNLSETAEDDPKSADNLIINLCSGDLEKTLKLVPSRDLARQLGISDQKLRREIYLARQRALKKRPKPKYYSEVSTTSSDDSCDILDELKNADESKFEGYFDLEIPTCASPISTVSSNTERFDDVVMEQQKEEEVIDEWSIESLIRSDLYEP